VAVPFDSFRNVSATVNGATNFTLDTPVGQGHFQVRITDSGGPHAVTFPAGVLWQGGTAYTTTTAGQVDIINLFRANNATWLASYGTNWVTA
jgi:hypothetical protein